jgi:predicted DNA-binding protein YlxM (UPF0122 family)
MNDPTKPQLVRLYWRENFSQSEIGQFYDVTGTTIGTWMDEYDIPTYVYSSQLETPLYRREQVLEYLYWNEMMSCQEIGDLFGVTNKGIQYQMEKNGVEVRTLEEAQYVRKHGEMPPEQPTVEADPNSPPVMMADGAGEDWPPEDLDDKLDELQDGVEQEHPATDDPEPGSEDLDPGELSEKDKKAIAKVIQAWDGAEYSDLSVTEIIRQVGVTRYWVTKAVNRLVYEGKVEVARTVGVSTTYTRVDSNVNDIVS